MSINHYEEAEQLLTLVESDDLLTAERRTEFIATAQVHATLAAIQQTEELAAANGVYQVAAERVKQSGVTVPADEVLHTHSGIVVPWPPSTDLKGAMMGALSYALPSNCEHFLPGAVDAVLDTIREQVTSND